MKNQLSTKQARRELKKMDSNDHRTSRWSNGPKACANCRVNFWPRSGNESRCDRCKDTAKRAAKANQAQQRKRKAKQEVEEADKDLDRLAIAELRHRGLVE